MSTAVPGDERRAGEGVDLALRETRSRRCLDRGRCLGMGRGGRAARPWGESSEEEEVETERQRTSVTTEEEE